MNRVLLFSIIYNKTIYRINYEEATLLKIKNYVYVPAILLVAIIIATIPSILSNRKKANTPFLEITELEIEIETDQKLYSLKDTMIVEVYANNNRSYDVKLLPLTTRDFNIVYLNDSNAIRQISHADYFSTEARENGSIPIQAGQRVLLGTKSFRIREEGIIRINYLDTIKDIEIIEET